jgi:hypothetical protein
MAVILIFGRLGDLCELEVRPDMLKVSAISGGSPHSKIVYGRSAHHASTAKTWEK